MKQLSIEDAKHLAKLSALKFSDAELADVTRKLNSALEVISQIEDVKIDVGFKYENAVSISQLREDTIKPSMEREVALQNAPKQRKGCFNVPKVVD